MLGVGIAWYGRIHTFSRKIIRSPGLQTKVHIVGITMKGAPEDHYESPSRQMGTASEG